MGAPSGPSRRQVVVWAGAAAAGLQASQALGAEPEAAVPPVTSARTAGDALGELLAGNARFAEGRPTGPRRAPADFKELVAGQAPFAAIVGCADSRVAPEI